MWVRKRIEITTGELLLAMVSCLRFADRSQLSEKISQQFSGDNPLVCLSIRSGFDLLLRAMDWPAGSEIILSDLTIPDMSHIVRRHQLQTVGVDIDPETLSPLTCQLEQKISSNTRAIVIAHLFGGQIDLEPIIEIARKHHLMVIEDCAQVYVGNHFRGHPDADVSMFSFGPIKTNTALGGSLFFVRDKAIRQIMETRQRRWPVQGRMAFFRRLVKYGFVKLISTRPVARSIANLMRLFGASHDGFATSLARGFAGANFFQKIRKQPSVPLLVLLNKKLRNFDDCFISDRNHRGDLFRKHTRGQVEVLGSKMNSPSYWLLAILVKNREQLKVKLWRHGFDATTNSSLRAVSSLDLAKFGHRRNQSDSNKPFFAEFLLDHMIILPFASEMPVEEIQRLAEIILESEPTSPKHPKNIGWPTRI